LDLSIQDDETSNPKPTILKFQQEAKNVLYNWQKTNADQCNDTENDVIKGIYSKLEMYALRLALIIEMMSWACDENDKKTISVESVQGATKLVEYFKNSAIKVYSIITNFNPLEKLPANIQKLYNLLPDNFTTKIGTQIAVNNGIPERTFKRFLADKEFFNKLSRGEYEKRI
jgi:hypothetical protein